VPAFFAAKLKEQESRHAKFNDTAYNLEPNIKESPGGLRDLHMIIWLTQSLNIAKQQSTTGEISHIANTWAMLAKQNIISTLAVRQIRQHEQRLQLLRIRLHFLSDRREDRLLFDYQNDLAAALGYSTTARKRASDQLMQSYYRSAKFVRLFNEILLKSLKNMLSTTPPVIRPINDHFEAHDQYLEAKSAGLLQQNPSAIF
jgi:[protein-PII] uridylyltransferase